MLCYLNNSLLNNRPTFIELIHSMVCACVAFTTSIKYKIYQKSYQQYLCKFFFNGIHDYLFTHSPISRAPRSSNILPRIQACLRVRTFAPTDVPKELATSFAPMAKDRIKAMMKPTITIHRYSSGIDAILACPQVKINVRKWKPRLFVNLLNITS